MKILKSLNKKSFSIILIIFLSFKAYAEDQPVDIWSIEKKTNEDEVTSVDSQENKKHLF